MSRQQQQHTVAAPEQMVREYTSVNAMQRDMAKLARQGWRVVSQTSYRPKSSLGRKALMCFLVLLFPRKQRFVVTYSR